MIDLLLKICLAFSCAISFSIAAQEVSKVSPTQSKSEARTARKVELETMFDADQKHRMSINQAKSENDRKALWEAQTVIDQANQARLDELVMMHGWPGSKEFGRKAANAAFLIVQHSNLEMMKRYFPAIKTASEQGDASKEWVALLDDRIRMYEERPQVYGTQLQRDSKTGKLAFWMIEDEVNVDKRRAMMGMPPLAEYAKLFGLDYVVPVAVPSKQDTATKSVEKSEK